jgi:hypothetical protein
VSSIKVFRVKNENLTRSSDYRIMSSFVQLMCSSISLLAEKESRILLVMTARYIMKASAEDIWSESACERRWEGRRNWSRSS